MNEELVKNPITVVFQNKRAERRRQLAALLSAGSYLAVEGLVERAAESDVLPHGRVQDERLLRRVRDFAAERNTAVRGKEQGKVSAHRDQDRLLRTQTSCWLLSRMHNHSPPYYKQRTFGKREAAHIRSRDSVRLAEDGLNQHGLAAPHQTHDRHQLAARHLQVDILELKPNGQSRPLRRKTYALRKGEQRQCTRA